MCIDGSESPQRSYQTDNSIRKENQSQTLLLQHAAYHQIKGFFDFPCLKVDSESLILNTY
jgi:hypothetical protein